MTHSTPAAPGRFRKGAVAVAIGLVVASLSTYAFQAIAGRSLSTSEFGVFASLWSAFFIVVIVAFLAVEQTITARISGGEGVPGRRVSVLIVGFWVLGSVVLGAVAHQALHIDTLGVLILLPVGVAGYGMLYPIRGVMAGQRRFRAYGALFAAESLVRLVITIGLVTVDQINLTTLVGAVAIAPVVVAILSGRAYESFDWGKSRDAIHLSAIGALGFANLALVALLNLGPVLLVWLGNPEAAALLFAGLLLVRSPLYLFQSVTSTALSYFGGLLAEQPPHLVFRAVRVRVGALGLAGLLAVIPAALVAVPIVELLFGDRLVLDAVDYAILGFGVVGIIVGLLMTQFFIAARAEWWIAGTWAIGLALFTGVALGGSGSLVAVEIALAMSGVAVSGIFLVFGGYAGDHPRVGGRTQSEI